MAKKKKAGKNKAGVVSAKGARTKKSVRSTAAENRRGAKTTAYSSGGGGR